MDSKKCTDCKFYTPFSIITHYRLGKPIHGACTKYNESVSFIETCDEFEVKEQEKLSKILKTDDN